MAEGTAQVNASADVMKLVDEVMKLTAEDRRAFTATYIGKLSVMELADQVKTLETVFGVTAAAPVAVAAAGAAAPVEEEKTTFDVILKETGEKKIQVIKAVRQVTNLGLKEAKALVDGAPGKVKEGVSKEESDKIKQELEAAGAVVEIK